MIDDSTFEAVEEPLPTIGDGEALVRVHRRGGRLAVDGCRHADLLDRGQANAAAGQRAAQRRAGRTPGGGIPGGARLVAGEMAARQLAM